MLGCCVVAVVVKGGVQRVLDSISFCAGVCAFVGAVWLFVFLQVVLLLKLGLKWLHCGVGEMLYLLLLV